MGISRDKWHKRRATGGKRAPIRMKRKFELGRQPAMTRIGERRVHQVRCRGGYIKFRALRVDHGNYSWPGEAVTRKARIICVVYNPTNPEYVRTNTIVKGSIVQIDSTPFKNWYQKHYGVLVGKATPFVKAKKSTEKKSRKHRPAPIEKLSKVKEVVVEKKGKGEKKAEKKSEKKVEKKVEKKKEEAKPVKKSVKPTATTVAKPDAKPVAKKVVKRSTKKPEAAVEGTPKKERKCKANNSRKSGSHKPSGATLKRWRLRNATRVLEAALSEQFEKGRLYAKISTSPGQIGSADGYVLEGEELTFYVKKMQLKKKK